MGMDAYLADLGLTERVLYDAQGNSFVPQAVDIRIMEGIRQWSNGEGLERRQYEAPSRGREVFQEICAYTRARGLPAVEPPFPYDLRADLLADRDGREPMTSGTPAAGGDGGGATTNTTAGDGRMEAIARGDLKRRNGVRFAFAAVAVSESVLESHSGRKAHPRWHTRYCGER